MQRSRLYILIIVGLLLSNLMLVGYILSARSEGQRHGPPPPPGHGGPRNLIIERLHFTEQQVAEYDKLIQWHRSEISRADERVMELKNSLYATLLKADTPTSKDSLITEIARVQQHIEEVHYTHFEDIRNLCTADQKPAFEELSGEIASLFSHPPHKHGRP